MLFPLIMWLIMYKDLESRRSAMIFVDLLAVWLSPNSGTYWIIIILLVIDFILLDTKPKEYR